MHIQRLISSVVSHWEGSVGVVGATWRRPLATRLLTLLTACSLRPHTDHPPDACPHSGRPRTVPNGGKSGPKRYLPFRGLSVWCKPRPLCPPSGREMDQSELTPSHACSRLSCRRTGFHAVCCGGEVCGCLRMSVPRVAKARCSRCTCSVCRLITPIMRLWSSMTEQSLSFKLY